MLKKLLCAVLFLSLWLTAALGEATPEPLLPAKESAARTGPPGRPSGTSKAIVAPIAAAHQVDRIYLFGSYARGDASPSSDIDLRVDKGRLKGLIALGALYEDLTEGLGKELDLLTTGSLDEQFLQHIAGEEVLIYGPQ